MSSSFSGLKLIKLEALAHCNMMITAVIYIVVLLPDYIKNGIQKTKAEWMISACQHGGFQVIFSYYFIRKLKDVGSDAEINISVTKLVVFYLLIYSLSSYFLLFIFDVPVPYMFLDTKLAWGLLIWLPAVFLFIILVAKTHDFVVHSFLHKM